jgi:paraquat-inducible protein A
LSSRKTKNVERFRPLFCHAVVEAAQQQRRSSRWKTRLTPAAHPQTFPRHAFAVEEHLPNHRKPKPIQIPITNSNARRLSILFLLAVSIGLLIPGLFAPVLTIRGVLKPEGVAHIAPLLLEKGLDGETLRVLQSMMKPDIVALLEASGGDLRQTVIKTLGPRLTAALQQNVQAIEVYEQTRSIVGSVRHLYEVRSPTPATLILLFSVVVPLAKAALVLWSIFMADAARRRNTLNFVELIAKWSMADVFAVALFIAFLAAQASQVPPDAPNVAPPLVAFTASFGVGFYWFAAYCIFPLATQQLTSRWFYRAARGQAS